MLRLFSIHSWSQRSKVSSGTAPTLSSQVKSTTPRTPLCCILTLWLHCVTYIDNNDPLPSLVYRCGLYLLSHAIGAIVWSLIPVISWLKQIWSCKSAHDEIAESTAIKMARKFNPFVSKEFTRNIVGVCTIINHVVDLVVVYTSCSTCKQTVYWCLSVSMHIISKLSPHTAWLWTSADLSSFLTYSMKPRRTRYAKV